MLHFDCEQVLLSEHLECIASRQLLDEASCVAISPAQSCFAALCVPPVVVATTWSNVALCLAIRNRELEEVLNIDVPSGADSPKFSIPSLARALALISIHEQPYVFCATVKFMALAGSPSTSFRDLPG